MKKIKMTMLALAAALALPAMAAASNVAVTVQQLAVGGTTATYTSSGLTTTDTYQFTNDGRALLHIKKTGAGAATITVTTQGTVQGFAIADVTFTIPATTGDQFAGPFPASLFNDSSGLVNFTLSDTVGLSFAALRL